MKKIIFIGLLISNIFASQTIELLGDMNYPPYSYKYKDDAKGVYVDIIKKAFSKMPNYDVKFNMVAWKRAIILIQKGKAVGFFPPYYSKERTKWINFSEPIVAETSVVMASTKVLEKRENFPKDFYGLTVCMNRGFTLLVGGDKFAKAVENKKIKRIDANSNKECLIRVQRGMADFYINDQLIDISSFPYIKKAMKINSNFGHIGFTLKEKRYPFMKDLQKNFNSVIKQMKKSGEIERIIQKYKEGDI